MTLVGVAVMPSILSSHADNCWTFKDWPEVSAKDLTLKTKAKACHTVLKTPQDDGHGLEDSNTAGYMQQTKLATRQF